MTLGLHPECLKRLQSVLAEQLSQMTVRHRRSLDFSNALYLHHAQNVLPQAGNQHELLEKYISEAPLLVFVHGVLSRELEEEQDYNVGEGPIPLSSIVRYANSEEVAKRLTDALESLPWQYCLSIPLPPALSAVFCSQIKTYGVSDQIDLVTPDQVFQKAFPLASGIEKRDRALNPSRTLLGKLLKGPLTWDDKVAYFQVRVDGFIGRVGTTPLMEALASLKAFCGLAIALNLVKVERSFPATPLKSTFYVHRKAGGSWVVEDTRELDSFQSEILNDLILHDLDGAFLNDAERAHWMRDRLSLIESIFRAGERAHNVVLGAQWVFDSHCGADELLQFVQSAVVVEILLGDKASSDQTGLGELLANRCAYLIADTHSQRNGILADFREIYKVRSRIVHQGKSRLSFAERELFNKLQWMCRRIIQKEAELLKKDATKGG